MPRPGEACRALDKLEHMSYYFLVDKGTPGAKFPVP